MHKVLKTRNFANPDPEAGPKYKKSNRPRGET